MATKARVTRQRPGMVRDAIVQVLEGRQNGASVQEITSGVIELIGDVPPSSVRSYLRLNTPALFARTDRAQYTLNGFEEASRPARARRADERAPVHVGRDTLYLERPARR